MGLVIVIGADAAAAAGVRQLPIGCLSVHDATHFNNRRTFDSCRVCCVHVEFGRRSSCTRSVESSRATSWNAFELGETDTHHIELNCIRQLAGKTDDAAPTTASKHNGLGSELTQTWPAPEFELPISIPILVPTLRSFSRIAKRKLSRMS